MDVITKRRSLLRKWLKGNNCDAFLVSNPLHLRYLFGFTGEGMGIVGKRDAVATDRRFEFEAASQLPKTVKSLFTAGGHLAGVKAHLGALTAPKIAFEKDHLTYAVYESVNQISNEINLYPVSGVIEQQRLVKDVQEVEYIRKAAKITDKVLARIFKELEAEVTEKEIAYKLEQNLLAAGADDLAFSSIVAFGPSAANCHYMPGSRKLKPGMGVKIDCGAKVEGYCSDITRTICFGEPDVKFREIYNIVLQAQQKSVAAVKAGMTGGELDGVARDYIAAAGYGPQFSHSLGHGVGLNVHEKPGLFMNSEEVMQAGMVVTIEPGIYIDGWGGIRVEDSVLVTEAGCEVLTRCPKYRIK